MNFIIEYWQVLVAIAILVVVMGIGAYYFFTQPSKKQIEQIKQWLLFATLEAERELGEKTGVIKLRFVYNLFLSKFTWIAYFMSFEMFSSLVDEALDKMKIVLETNKAVENLVTSKIIDVVTEVK